VFLCKIPFLAALSTADTALRRAAFAPSALLFATSLSTAFASVFSKLLMDLFRSVLFSACRTLFMADLFFFGAACAGNVLPPVHYKYRCLSGDNKMQFFIKH
jgi:hypothetical protein